MHRDDDNETGRRRLRGPPPEDRRVARLLRSLSMLAVAGLLLAAPLVADAEAGVIDRPGLSSRFCRAPAEERDGPVYAPTFSFSSLAPCPVLESPALQLDDVDGGTVMSGTMRGGGHIGSNPWLGYHATWPVASLSVEAHSMTFSIWPVK